MFIVVMDRTSTVQSYRHWQELATGPPKVPGTFAWDARIKEASSETSSQPPWVVEDLRRARSQLIDGLLVVRGGVMDERSGTVMERTYRADPMDIHRELLPDQDWGDFVPVAVVEDRIADLEAKLASAERRAAA